MLATVLLVACARPDLTPPAPVTRAPDIRVGVVVGVLSLTLGGGGALTLAAPQGAGGWLGEIPATVAARVEVVGGSLQVRVGGAVLAPGPEVLVAGSNTDTRVRLNGREYRGTLSLRLAGGRLSAVNVVDLEDYVGGVVGAEMGLRGEAELSALRAQAVVSRTIALRRLARVAGSARPWDILGTVADQAYAGTGYETELSIRAARETRGLGLRYGGQPIDAFFHSTCAGRTAPGAEVFAAGDRPYLRAISDRDPTGRAWCALSPRYRWRQTWTGEGLVRTLRATLPSIGAPAGIATSLRDIRVLTRTGTDRVGTLLIQGARDSVILKGPLARQVLQTAEGSVLRSADFTVQLTREPGGSRIVQLAVDGAGAGHGVGMCQWGAIGRARAGLSYEQILAAYFPGTELSRMY